jgi:tripartite-type tricarboxylate transporter receptor subunit TctC
VALAALTLAITLQPAGMAAAQQTYPTRTVQLVLPYGAASATDIAARLFADRLSKLWGKPVIVENRPGGDGIVSLNSVRAAHDDHMLWMGPAGVINVLPYKHDTLPFDIKRDFVPIVSVVNVALAISTASSMKIDTADQLINRIKQAPGKLNAAASNGISEFLLFGFLKQKGLQVAQVPYRDIMQAPNDLVGGRIQVLATSIAVVQPLAEAGQIKVLLVTSKQRAPSMPNVPTAAEAGYPDLTFDSLGGVFGSPGMSEEERESIAAGFRKVAESDPDLARRLDNTGQILTIQEPSRFAAGVQEQRDKLEALAKILGIKAAAAQP